MEFAQKLRRRSHWKKDETSFWLTGWKWQSKREPARQPKRGPVYGWVTRGVREALVSTLKAYLTVLGGTQGAQNGRFRTYSADGFDRRILAT